MIPETSCAIVDVGGITHLVLPDLVAADRAVFSGQAELPLPLAATRIVRVLPGGPGEDFRWAAMTSDAWIAGDQPPEGGVAAAVAALLFGLALGAADLLGTELSTGRTRSYGRAEEDWWNGLWLCHPPDAQGALPVRYHASLILHGEVVLRARPAGTE